MGPPSWFINPIHIHELVRYIYHKHSINHKIYKIQPLVWGNWTLSTGGILYEIHFWKHPPEASLIQQYEPLSARDVASARWSDFCVCDENIERNTWKIHVSCLEKGNICGNIYIYMENRWTSCFIALLNAIFMEVNSNKQLDIYCIWLHSSGSGFWHRIVTTMWPEKKPWDIPQRREHLAATSYGEISDPKKMEAPKVMFHQFPSLFITFQVQEQIAIGKYWWN